MSGSVSIPAAIWSQPRSIQFLQLSDGLWRGIEVEFILGYMDGLLIPTFYCVGETSLCSISRSKLNVTLTQHGFKSRIELVMRFVVGICRIRFSVLGFVDWMLEGVKFHVEARRTPFFWTSRMLDVIVACKFNLTFCLWIVLWVMFRIITKFLEWSMTQRRNLYAPAICV